MATLGPTRPLHLDPLRHTVERYFEISLFAMIVTGSITLAGTGKLDAASLLFILAALGFRAFELATGKRTVLSVQTTSRLTIAYTVFYLFDFFALSGSFITATVHLVLFIMVVKMFSVQRERDHVYLAVISFLMILAAAILTVDSFFMAAFSLFLLLTVTTFVTMEMRRSYRTHDSAMASPEEIGHSALGVHGITVGLSPRQRMARSLSSTAVALVITIVVGASGIFFVLPRISTGYLSAFAGRNAFVTGFGDSVQLGDIGRIQQSDAVAMHVQFVPGTKVPSDLKFRGVSLDRFDGKSWSNRSWAIPIRNTTSSLPLSKYQLYISGITRLIEPKSDDVIQYRVLMEPIGSNAFFLVPTPLVISSDVREFGIERTGSILSTDPNRSIRIYTGRSFMRRPDPAAEESESDLAPAVRESYLQMPPLDPRIAELARDVTQNSVTTLAKAQAIEAYLQTRFGYTLEMYTAPGQDPLAYFLFTRKKGHCEYFASSMAIMLRTIGIPSRIVNGFRNGDLNDVTGSYVIRARNAHSWVEAYIPGFGWATFDPTPASDPVPETAWSRMLLYADAMREFWAEWVINYDFTHQNTLGTAGISKTRSVFDASRIWFRDKYEAMLERLRQTKSEVKANPRKMGTRVVIGLALMLLLLNLKTLITAIRNSRLASKPGRAPRAAATVWYERMTRLLGRKGLEKRPTQTPTEFVRSIHDEQLQRFVAKFTEYYERARFGGSSEDAGKLPQLYEEVETTLRQ